ncbi:hypothetical protein ACH47B_29205 [Rhodococcus sp. NPDC019627]|uniref:hypothetical protein n=1 Tax=unclassified Rhodococcus (in: high G+C Gram-positive bacteria) TaxID=192944 RepID=UPI00340AA392
MGELGGHQIDVLAVAGPWEAHHHPGATLEYPPVGVGVEHSGQEARHDIFAPELLQRLPAARGLILQPLLDRGAELAGGWRGHLGILT